VIDALMLSKQFSHQIPPHFAGRNSL